MGCRILLPDLFSVAGTLRPKLHTPRRPPAPHAPHLPAGQTSPPPREDQRRRDPEVNFESLVHPREFRPLPVRGRSVNAVVLETAAMAASRQTSSRSVQRMEPSGSAESSVATRTPVPTLSSPSPSPELPVSPGQVAELSGKNLWEQICEGRQPGLAAAGGTRAAGRGPRVPAPTVRQAADVRGRGPPAPNSTLGEALARPRGLGPGAAVEAEGRKTERGSPQRGPGDLKSRLKPRKEPPARPRGPC